MCGIGVVLGKTKDNAKINKILDGLRHRGPDGEGIYEDKNISMVHTRLRIIDTDIRSDQPMLSKCKRYIIVFNGEIYNYKNLERRFSFRDLETNSDTEILLNLFVRFGSECTKYLKGMYSFAIWDKHEEKLFCAVDHFGIKPLYYTFFENQFYICSEPKILSNLRENTKYNKQVISDYLALGLCDHSEQTFFKDIFRLMGGNQFWVDKDGRILKEKYWELNKVNNQISNYEIAKDDIYQKLFEITALGTVSDVPVGICMSGGLDSSTMLEILSRFQNFNKGQNGLTGFTFDYEEDKYSEYKYTKVISDKYSLDLKRSLFTIDDFEYWFYESNIQQGEPQTGLPILGYSKCVKKAREAGYKVLLDASGIDEFFGGYTKYNKFVNLKNEPGTSYLIENQNKRVAQDGTFGSAIECLNNNCLKKYKDKNKITNYLNSIMKMNMYLDMFFYKLPRALRFRDRLSMSYGCELRPPFLDHELVSFSFQLPDNFLIADNINKKILRDVMSNKIPFETAFAAKRQVQTPQREWFRYELKEWIYHTLKNSYIWDLGLLDRDKSYEKLNNYMNGIGDNSMFIWQWLDLDQWLKNNF